MSTATHTQPWEPLNIPLDNAAELEAHVAAAEGLIEQAQWRALSIRAARVRALADAARAAVVALSEYEAKACLTDWQGAQAMSSLAYRVGQVEILVRQSRRQFTVYQHTRARLEAKFGTPKGDIPA